MPNDSGNSFPLPSEQTPVQPEVKLTDEVAPDLSAAPSLPVRPIPATMPASVSRPFPIITLLLLVISIGAIAATYFFYQQTKSLNVQLNQITKTLEQQTIKENQTIITATPTINLTPTSISTLSAEPTPFTATTPNKTQNTGSGLIWSHIGDAMTMAQEKYPNAQLILVKAENVGNTSQTIKYWFRQNTTDRKYLYLLKDTSKDLVLVDQNVTVFESSLLPSLNNLVTNNQLGLDLNDAIAIAGAACPTTFDCVSASTTGQYIKSGSSLIWQITYKPTDGSQPFVVQIDSASKKIIYKSL